MSMRFIVVKMKEENVDGFLGSSSVAYASWQVYHVTATVGRETIENSIDSRLPGQGGWCIEHTT